MGYINGLNGEQFGSKWKAYEQAMERHNDFGLKGQQVSEQMARYAEGIQYDQMKALNKAQGKEYARMLAAEKQDLAAGLSGANVTDNPIQISTKKNSVNVVRKTKIGDKKTGYKYFFVDKAGKVYQVDKSAYNAIGTKGNIKLSGTMANPVKTESLPKRVKEQFNKYMVSDVTEDVTKLYQGKHPANAQLGTAHATPTSGMTWAKYAEQRGTTYTPPTSGVAEADRRAQAIIAGNKEKQRIKDILGKKPEFNPANLDKWAGVGPNKELDNMNAFYRDLEQRSDYKRRLGEHLKKPTEFSPANLEKWAGVNQENAILDGMNDNYRFLQERSDYKRALGEHLKKPTEFSPENLDKWAGLGPNKELDNMNDYYRALEDSTKSKGINWKKIGKWGAIAAGVALVAGLAVWGIKKYNENKEAELNKPEPAPQPTPTPIPQPDPIVPPVKPEPAPQPVAPVEPTEPTEPTEPSLVDADGKMTVQKGDGLWHIAERYLEDKFKAEPEKFANLTKKEQNEMIYKEMTRIAKLYEAQLNEDNQSENPIKVTYQDIVINGKTQRVAIPMLRTGQKIQVVEKLDQAA